MKEFNLFDLYVIENDNHKFICELDISKNLYIEIFTKEIIELENNKEMEPLSKYYSLLQIIKYYNNLGAKEPLMLKEKELLIEYININKQIVDKFDHYNKNIDKVLNDQEEYLKEFKKLKENNPELAKELAMESLKKSGILDENGELAYPYSESVDVKQLKK